MKKVMLLIAISILLSVFALVLVIMWFNQSPYTPDSPEYDCRFITQKTFEPTNKNFAIWPDKYDIARGHEMRLCVGIKNNAEDNESHQFVINVAPLTASGGVCPGGNLNACGNLKTEMQSWVTWDKQSYTLQIGKVGYRIVTISPSSNAKLGSYVFSVIACEDMQYSNCTLQNYNWGNPQQLTITVKS
jgi:hypothetical protein